MRVLLSLLIALNSAPAAFAQVVTQSAPVRVGPAVVAPVVGAQLVAPNAGLTPAANLANVSLQAPMALPTALPTAQASSARAAAAPVSVAAAAPVVAAAAPLSAAAPAALPQQASAPSAPSALRPEAPAAMARAESETRGLFSRLRGMLSSFGSISDSKAEDAHGLGARIMNLLGTSAVRSAEPSAPAAKAEKSSSLKPAKAKASPKKARSPKAVKALKADAAPAGLNANQLRMIQTLEQIAALYTEHYAPQEWKQSQYGVDFAKEFAKAKAQVVANPGMGQHEFQKLLADFVHTTRDYHVGIQFHSTEAAGLPIFIMSAQGKYYLAYINRSALPEAKFPYKEGDEVVEFDGKPVSEVVKSLTRTPNIAETDARLAEMYITNRIRRTGVDVPKGPVLLKIRTEDGVVHDVAMEWKYKPEMVPVDTPIRDGGIRSQAGLDDLSITPAPSRGWRDAIRAAIRRLIPSMAHPYAEVFTKAAGESAGNGYMIGAKNSFVPKLGQVIWQLPPQVAAQVPFDAYIYKNEQGRRIGYIRIPDYMGDEQAAGVFGQLMAQYQKNTDGLVIDQVNNPGGSLFYMYALLSMLTDKPLAVPQHKLLIDESDAAWAADILQQAGMQAAKKAFAEEMAEETAGFQADDDQETMMRGIIRYAKFILSELKAGRRFTGLIHLFGLDRITPQKAAQYTKPIVVLINELDFSCADFFPAIMQDNKRAVLFGVRTSGAGGGVKSLEFPNQHGIAGLSYTWTIAQRENGQPIENLGVKPDVEYALTQADFRSGMKDYAKAVNAALSAQLPAKSAAEIAAEEAAEKAAKEAAEKAKKMTPAQMVEKLGPFIEQKGKELPAAAVAQFSDIFGLPAGLQMKGLGVKGGNGSQNLAGVYGKTSAAGLFVPEGYFFLGSFDNTPYGFLLSPSGELLKAGLLDENQQLVEMSAEDMKELVDNVVKVWSAIVYIDQVELPPPPAK